MNQPVTVNDIVFIGKSKAQVPVTKTASQERLLGGTPTATDTRYFGDDPGGYTCGVWECTPGSFKASYELNEFYFVITGRVRIVDSDGGEVVCLPGDYVMVPAGFVGEWHVEEHTKKIYIHAKP